MGAANKRLEKIMLDGLILLYIFYYSREIQVAFLRGKPAATVALPMILVEFLQSFAPTMSWDFQRAQACSTYKGPRLFRLILGGRY